MTHTTKEKQVVRKSVIKDVRTFNKKRNFLARKATPEKRDKAGVEKVRDYYLGLLNDAEVEYVQKNGPQTEAEWHMFFIGTKYDYPKMMGISDFLDERFAHMEERRKKYEEEKEITDTNEKVESTQAQAETKNNGGNDMKFEEFKSQKEAERAEAKTKNKGGVNMKNIMNNTGRFIKDNAPVSNKKMSNAVEGLYAHMKENTEDAVTNSMMIQLLAKELGVELPDEEVVREYAKSVVEPEPEEEKEESPRPEPKGKMSFMERVRAGWDNAKADFKEGYEEEYNKGVTERETREAKKKEALAAFMDAQKNKDIFKEAVGKVEDEVETEESVESEVTENSVAKKEEASDDSTIKRESVDDILGFGKPLA